MDSSYFPEFPKDDYALSVLTQAASIHKSSENNTSTNRRPNSGFPAEHAATLDNDSPDFQERNSFLITKQQDIGRSINLLQEQSGSGNQLGGGHNPIGHGVTSQDPGENMHNSRTMGTMSFNSLLGQPGQQHGHGVYDGIRGQLSQDIGILSAETYDDGSGNSRSKDTTGTRRKFQNEMPFGMVNGEVFGEEGSEEHDSNRRSRKKHRVDSDDDEARKKTRGRPRVDTRDETAADRRRTQIRMAQRAYRHRKETTISSLEKQVQDLRSTNEEMNNIFITLHDYAMSKGIAQREPEFGQQLASTTERFLNLAKSSQNEDHEEDFNEVAANEHEHEISRRAKGRQKSPKKKKGVPSPTEPAPAPEHSTSAWGGYTISKDDSPVEEVGLPYQQQNHSYRNDLQIITRPTEDNASFPFDFMDLQSYRVEVPQVEDFSQQLFPQSQLPLPRTHEYHEFSFARRLFRRASEKAFQLIRSTDPRRAARLQQVFGLCLMYDSRANIEARLRKIIGRSAKESLPDWRQPFLHVGGAGTYYPQDDNEPDQEDMLKFPTDYSMGPFSPTTSQAQDVMDGMHCNLPGFEGEFFDPNDVEGYLRGRGLEIPPHADLVTAELDITALDGESPRSDSSGSVNSAFFPKTPTPVDNLFSDLGHDQDPNFELPKLDSTLTKTLNLPFPLGFTDWDNGIRTGGDVFSQFNITPDQQHETASSNLSSSQLYSKKRAVTISVPVLLEELTNRGVCLGRAPGYRPADVNAAIIAAIKAGF